MGENNSPDLHVFNVEIKKLVKADRQRKDFGNITSLQLSIESHGLICPIVVEETKDCNGKEAYLLIAGERRLYACGKLGWKEIPALLKKNLDELSRQELELEENITRKQYNYLEEARAVAKVHKLRQDKYGAGLPGMFSKVGWTQQATADTLGLSVGKVSQDLNIAIASEKYPQLKSCKNRKEAIKLIRQLDEGKRNVFQNSTLMQQMRENFTHLTLTESFKKVEPSSVDLLFLDVSEDLYDNHFESAHQCMSYTGQGFMFFQFQDLQKIQTLLGKYGFNFSEKPYMWHIKTKDDYVPYLWFSKGLAAPPKNLHRHISSSPDADCLDSRARPYKFYHTLITACTNQGQFVFEPKSYGLGVVKVCMDAERNCLVCCSNKSLYEQCMLKVGRA